MKIQSMTDHTGAEVRGVDLARPVAPEVREALNRAFVEAQCAGDPRPGAEARRGSGRRELFG